MGIKSNYSYRFLVFTSIAAILACGKKPNESTTSNVQVLDQKTIVKTTLTATSDGLSAINVLGIILSDKEAKPAFKTGGVIAKTFLKEGDVVKKGQLLATLMMSEIDAQVRQAEEGLNKAERDMKRVKNLYADSVATLEQFQNVTTAYELARKTVEIVKFNKQYSEVRSPISGRIVKQIMHEGEIVGPGIPIYGVIGTGAADWKVNAGLIDRDWARVKEGDRGLLVLDAFPSVKYDVVVSKKSIIGGNANSTIDVELKFKSPPKNLAAGLIGKVTISPQNKGAATITLPIEALTKSNGSEAVVFTIENGKAKKTIVKIGSILGDKVEIIAGLHPQQEVITIGSMYLEDGDAVEVKN